MSELVQHQVPQLTQISQPLQSPINLNSSNESVSSENNTWKYILIGALICAFLVLVYHAYMSFMENSESQETMKKGVQQ
jgi:hypothetical protein